MRASRREEFLAAAREIVNTEGQTGLTMLRLAKAVGTSEGNVYNYFASKTALLAELEIEALGAMARSFDQGQATLVGRLQAADAGPELTVLCRAVAASRFPIAAEASLPNEVELSRRILSQPDSLESDHIARVLAAGLDFLGLGAQLLDEAAAREVLSPGAGLQRSLLSLTSVIGVVITNRLDQWDAGLFNGRVMALELIEHLFVGWGADPELLAEAGALLDTLTDEELAPRPQ